MINKQAYRLFFLGFLTLFLELILIRYLAGNIWNLGFFPNLVLLAVFLGMGIGFVFHGKINDRRSEQLLVVGCLLLFLLILLVRIFHPSMPGFSGWSGNIGGELFFSDTPQTAKTVNYLSFFCWFFLVVSIFILISQLTAKIFRQFEPLKAYSLDIAGSLCGILSFMVISFFSLPAYIWFILLSPLFLLIIGYRRKIALLISLLSVISCSFIAWQQDQQPLSLENFAAGKLEVRWSPYQKVEYLEVDQQRKGLFVNGINHQFFHSKKSLSKSFYKVPYLFRQQRHLDNYKNVLIIGAGCGNDVASAIANGAEHVDAVEIDPIIARFGEKYHETKVYQDQRVNLVIDDARAFLSQTDKKYDLIVFALTDSLVKVSPLTQLRLENYVYTLEAVKKAYSLLSDQGEMVFYNFYREQWLKDRLYQTIFQASQRVPLPIFHKGNFWMLVVGRKLSGTLEQQQKIANIEVATDDWPFIYLKERTMPKVYLAAIALLATIIILLLFTLHRSSQKLESKENIKSLLFIKIAFVLFGSAFLLLETKSVIQFSLLFGTTWWNNSLVFLAILSLVLAANYTAYFLPEKRSVLITIVIALVASCLVTFIYPLANLLIVDNLLLRFVAASLLTFLPIFFANLMFSVTFRRQKVAEHLFGWNLLGATLGGVLEYSSMLLGYNALSIIIVSCYLFALYCLIKAKNYATT